MGYTNPISDGLLSDPFDSDEGRYHEAVAREALDDDLGAWPTLPDGVVKSAGRALQILEFFDDTRRWANMVDVSRALGYPESSTSILLRSLVMMGYLEFNRYTRAYHPTNRVRLLGSWVEPKLFEGDAVIRLMERVNKESSDAVILGARNSTNAQYIHVEQLRTSLYPRIPTGTVRPISASIVGYALLSRMQESEVGQLTRRVNSEAHNPEQVNKVADVLERVAEVRRNGYVCVRSKLRPGTSVLAMPLPAELSHSPLVIAIGGVTERVEAREAELAQLLRSCIDEQLHS
jgi:DNA-binding IclR family transcriptional regulator